MGSSDEDLTNVGQMQVYGLLSVASALLACVCWTVMAYYARLAIESGELKELFDLAIDNCFYYNLFATLMYLSYLATESGQFDAQEFVYGQLAGVLYLAALFLVTIVMERGPGGPICAVV